MNDRSRSTFHNSTSTSFYQILKEDVGSWLLLFTTVILFTLTILYATNSLSIQNVYIASSSRSSVIALLNILSQITGVLLAATMIVAVETTYWLLASREKGLALSSFLGMQSSASLFALLCLILGAGTKLTSRIWSLIRLIANLLVPLLSIIILCEGTPNLD